MSTTNLEFFRHLALQEVERNNTLFKDNPEYELTMEDDGSSFKFYQTNDEQACCFDQLIKIADVCRMSWYINVTVIHEVKLTPQLCVF